MTLRNLLLLLACLVILPASARDAVAGPDGVTVTTSRSLYVPGDTVEITVQNSRKDSIFLAGCASYQVELFVAEQYIPSRAEHCVSEGQAVEVKTGTHTLTFVPTPENTGSIMRIAVPYGWGCSSGMALSGARCTDFATAYSKMVRVNKKSSGDEG